MKAALVGERAVCGLCVCRLLLCTTVCVCVCQWLCVVCFIWRWLLSAYGGPHSKHQNPTQAAYFMCLYKACSSGVFCFI